MSFDWSFLTGENVYVMQLGCAPILPGSLVVLCKDGINDKQLVDNGLGDLTGDGVGIVEYEHGLLAVAFFSPAPLVGTQITADYDPIEGGCGVDCGKCATHFVKLSVTPGEISGSDQFTLNDAWQRLFTKIERDIKPVHVEILRELLSEYYVISVGYRFDVTPADEETLDSTGLHTLFDDTSW